MSHSITDSDLKAKIGQVLFVDLIGYSRLLIDDQHKLIEQLNQIVRSSEQFRAAEAADKLIRLPTGDGFALVFFDDPQAPVRCAIELNEALQSHRHIRVRMGIHSGPVREMRDVNDRVNVAGAGIDFAQRVMGCGDAGHILLSQRTADDLLPFKEWGLLLHKLGEVEVKHGIRLAIVNLYDDKIGNPALPAKCKEVHRRRNVLYGLLVLSLIALSIAVVAVARRQGGPSAFGKGIAVLPFQNLSKDEENAFFAEGVQDEILTDLSRVADLKVISRTSVMRYKGTDTRNLREIAQQLGVTNLVEGSVQRASNRVRVNAQLIDARADAHLWAQTYDRELADVFAIQTEIAQAIADRLRASLSATEKAAMAERPTSNLEAYDLYLEAKQLLGVWVGANKTEPSMRRAIDLLEQAVQHDPDFVMAYCRLAEAHENLYWFEFDRSPARIALAKSAVDRAVRLRPELGDTHLAQARFAYRMFRDYKTAAGELATARRTLPNDSEAIRMAGLIERRTGRWSEALQDLRKAKALDPRNFEVLRDVSDTLYHLHRYAEQEQELRHNLEAVPESAQVMYAKLTECLLGAGEIARAKKALALIPADYNPTGFGSYYHWVTALYAHDFDQAIAIVRDAPIPLPDSLSGAHPPTSYFIGQTARGLGGERAAREAFQTARTQVEQEWGGAATTDPVQLSVVARIDAALGDKEAAIAEGKRAVELRSTARDSFDGPNIEAALATVYAWTGDKELALHTLAALARVPAGPSYGDLCFNPRWDSVRADPRFAKLVEESRRPFAAKQ